MISTPAEFDRFFVVAGIFSIEPSNSIPYMISSFVNLLSVDFVNTQTPPLTV